MEQATFLLDNSFLEKINNESTRHAESQSVKNYEEFNKQIINNLINNENIISKPPVKKVENIYYFE